MQSIIIKKITLFIIIFYPILLPAQHKPLPALKKQLLYKDDFNTGLQQWIIETPTQNDPVIKADSGKLTIEVTGGATAWFKTALSGNYMIEYKRKVIMNGGKRDRLSDLNMFWAATDTRDKNLFTRSGVLEQYDSLQLYYVGMGGNSNSTTRFRKYEGNGSRTLLQEYLDTAHLLTANKEYLVQLYVYNGTTALYIDGQVFFSYIDKAPLANGWFGIRTTKSHQEVAAFKVYQLK